MHQNEIYKDLAQTHTFDQIYERIYESLINIRKFKDTQLGKHMCANLEIWSKAMKYKLGHDEVEHERINYLATRRIK